MSLTERHDRLVGLDGDATGSFAAVPEIQEAHIIAVTASVLARVRTATTEQSQDVLRRLHAVEGVSGTQAAVVLETFFERPVRAERTPPGAGMHPLVKWLAGKGHFAS